MQKGFKIRIYPTKGQEEKFWQHIGCCRYVWNWMLDHQQKNYADGGKHLSAFDMMNKLKPLKNDGGHDWLYEVSNTSLKDTCRDLDKAYKAFFKKNAKFPKFKSRKHSNPSYPVRSESLWFDGKYANIEKVGKVRYKTDFNLPHGTRGGKYYNARISYDGFKWYLSFAMECESQAPELTDKNMGIDLGIKELAVVAYGDEELVFPNINKSQQMRELEKRIKHLQRNISRKYEQNKVGNKYVKTNNIIREERKLKKLLKRQKDIRHNYVHQTTHRLVAMLPKQVVMEDLNVTGMMKNKHLSKVIQGQCFYEFRRQMKHKCEWNGIQLIEADRYYPSSKTCSCCGTIKRDLRLKDRTFICPECGLEIDRDYNAAINLMNYSPA